MSILTLLYNTADQNVFVHDPTKILIKEILIPNAVSALLNNVVQ